MKRITPDNIRCGSHILHQEKWWKVFVCQWHSDRPEDTAICSAKTEEGEVKYDISIKDITDFKSSWDIVIEKSKKAIAEIDPEDVKKYFERIKLIENSRFNRVYNYIKNLSDEELDKTFIKFLEWEKEYEEFEYTVNFCQTTSKIMSGVMSVFEKKGVKKDFDEDFFGSAYEYRGYLIKTYCGQGCFSRIFKGDKELFTTT